MDLPFLLFNFGLSRGDRYILPMKWGGTMRKYGSL